MRCCYIPFVLGTAVVTASAQNTVVPTLTAQSSLTVFAGSASNTIPAGTNITIGTFQQAALTGALPTGAMCRARRKIRNAFAAQASPTLLRLRGRVRNVPQIPCDGNR